MFPLIELTYPPGAKRRQKFWQEMSSFWNKIHQMKYTAVVAEWLWRWTWNPMGSPRAGSNPAGCVELFNVTECCLLLRFKMRHSIVVFHYLLSRTLKKYCSILEISHCVLFSEHLCPVVALEGGCLPKATQMVKVGRPSACTPRETLGRETPRKSRRGHIKGASSLPAISTKGEKVSVNLGQGSPPCAISHLR